MKVVSKILHPERLTIIDVGDMSGVDATSIKILADLSIDYPFMIQNASMGLKQFMVKAGIHPHRFFNPVREKPSEEQS